MAELKVNLTPAEASEQVTEKSGQTGVEQVVHNKQESDPQLITTLNPAMVGVTASVTMNMGDYNSARVEVSLVHPSSPEEIDEVYTGVKQWVEDRMSKLIDELESQKG